MHATRIPDALLARWPLPAVATVALVWPRTVALVLVAAGQTDGLLAVLALPAGQTLDVAQLGAGEMAVNVVARPTQNVALLAVVVGLASDPVGVDQLGRVRLVHAAGPLLFDAEPAVHRVLHDELLLVEVVGGGGLLLNLDRLRQANVQVVELLAAQAGGGLWRRQGERARQLLEASGRLVPGVNHQREGALIVY